MEKNDGLLSLAKVETNLAKKNGSEEQQVEDLGLSHDKAISYLEKRAKGLPINETTVANVQEEQGAQAAAENSNAGDSVMLAGKKRLRPLAFNAIKKGELKNTVELAYLLRPNSPKNYRIYSDT